MLDDLLEWVLGVFWKEPQRLLGPNASPCPVRVLLAWHPARLLFRDWPDCCLGLELSLKAQGL